MDELGTTRKKISIVTATYNCADRLPLLIESLRCQTDKDFEWIVADGASSDTTLDLVRSVTDFSVVVTSQPDFGIYDALNRALRMASGEYYIVAGADDQFESGAIASFRNAIDTIGADLLIAEVNYGHHRFRVKHGPSWVFGEKAYIANHSVATAFKLDLHRRFGFYSKRFPIAADSLFVLSACKGGATYREIALVAGTIGSAGVSTVDWAGSATELFRVQLIIGSSVVLQSALLLLRILKGASSTAKLMHDVVSGRLRRPRNS